MMHFRSVTKLMTFGGIHYMPLYTCLWSPSQKVEWR